MLRLVFEAVMVIAVVSCLYFMMKLNETGIQDQDDTPNEKNKTESE